MPEGETITWTLRLRDDRGQTSSEARARFTVGSVDWTAGWITHPWDDATRPACFRKRFPLDKTPVSATLYVCGLGYFSASLNGHPITPFRLDPAHTDYTKTCTYVLFPDLKGLEAGENTLDITVAAGWRYNDGRYLKNSEKPRFFGPLELSAMLVTEYVDGTKQLLQTDGSWECGQGPTVFSYLFDGETYDARIKDTHYTTAMSADPPGGVMRPMTIPPIQAGDEIEPVAVSQAEGGWILDFGKNIAGVARLRFASPPEPGRTITLRYFERLKEDGAPYLDNLRGAKATDTYIASGDETDNPSARCWQPQFTYHGFRYVELRGADPYSCPVRAVPLHTALKRIGRFRCGSAIINAVQDMVVLTERDNMHSILTDCPQRDERMGWMNDATVRFEETPYNFDTAAMFRKICRDISEGQRPDGAISCTAPKVFGSYPADPVCSSFLVAGRMAWLHSGDLDVIREQFRNYERWEECLLAHSEDHIVSYSYYGDWAGPAYACESMENARSAVTPGIFMSTGFSYYNCLLLSEFARLLGETSAENKYRSLAGSIKTAMLDKWYDSKNRVFATGSMACQAFALWLGLPPESDCRRIADALGDDLRTNGYRFTTGNLCTKYLLDVLADYGHVDDAYALVTREEYPSWGWMLQNEATTVWERFELKDSGGMNSYCHPMYGSVGAWFYSALAGLKPLDGGWKRFSVKPRLPRKLMSCQASVSTPLGDVSVRWVKRDGSVYLQLDVPFGASAEVEIGDVRAECGSGHHSFRSGLPG